jgi:hypothetical membrane protein
MAFLTVYSCSYNYFKDLGALSLQRSWKINLSFLSPLSLVHFTIIGIRIVPLSTSTEPELELIY